MPLCTVSLAPMVTPPWAVKSTPSSAASGCIRTSATTLSFPVRCVRTGFNMLRITQSRALSMPHTGRFLLRMRTTQLSMTVNTYGACARPPLKLSLGPFHLTFQLPSCLCVPDCVLGCVPGCVRGSHFSNAGDARACVCVCVCGVTLLPASTTTTTTMTTTVTTTMTTRLFRHGVAADGYDLSLSDYQCIYVIVRTFCVSLCVPCVLQVRQESISPQRLSTSGSRLHWCCARASQC